MDFDSIQSNDFKQMTKEDLETLNMNVIFSV